MKNIILLGFYLDFNQNLLDFVFKINLKSSTILRNKLVKSEEHSKFLIKEKNYLKKILIDLHTLLKKLLLKY